MAKRTTSEFIRLAQIAHKDNPIKDDYSKTIYVNKRIKVDIICPIHGLYHQSPSNHLGITRKPNRCSKCGSERASLKKTKTTKEDVIKKIQEYDNISLFIKEEPLLYNHAKNNGYISELHNYLPKVGDLYHRGVYFIVFPHIKTIYVGIAYNFVSRQKEHLMNKKTIEIYNLMNNEPYLFIEVTDYIDEHISVIEEEKYRQLFIKNNWNVLNKKYNPSRGGRKRSTRTYESCKEIASKFISRTEFYKEDKNTYKFCERKGIIEQICLELNLFFEDKPRGYWDNYDRCKEASKLCKSRNDFGLTYVSATIYSRRNGWIDEFFPKLPKLTEEEKVEKIRLNNKLQREKKRLYQIEYRLKKKLEQQKGV